MLLGALGYLLVLKAIFPDDCDTVVELTTLPMGDAFYDNMGIVKHGRLPAKAFSETQVQADILGHIKYLLCSIPAST